MRSAFLHACLLGLVTLVSTSAGCYSGSTDTAAAPGSQATIVGPLFTLRGKLVEKDKKGPLAQSIVVVEVGGRYLTNPDTSKGHPDYRFAAATNPDGTFEVKNVPAGLTADGAASPRWGLHTFENGYRYGTDLIELSPDGTPKAIEVTVSPHLAEDIKPTARDFKVEPARVTPGGKVVFSAYVESSGNLLPDGTIQGDALSEEVLIAETTTQWARAMDPPSKGIQGKGYANGVWRHEGAAPSKPGTYTFHLVSSSERCITSDRVSVDLVVEDSPDASAPVSPVACNKVPSLDSLLVLQQVATAPPAAQGGVILDGTYTLSAYRRYTGPGGASGPKADTKFHETAVYAGNVLQVNYGDSTFNVAETYRHEVSGTAFTHTRTCPSGPPAVFPGVYTASGAALSYFEDRGGGITDEFAFIRVN